MSKRYPGGQRAFVQSTDTLDLAWDALMETPLGEGQSLPLGLSPLAVSLLFDLAITAYREHVETGGIANNAGLGYPDPDTGTQTKDTTQT